MAAKELTWKQGDRYPALEVVLKDKNGIVDLSTATTVEFVMMDSAKENVVDGECSIVSATDGSVKYEWEDGDLDTVGLYKGEFIVTWADETETTFPNSGYVLIRVTEEATRAA